MGRLTRELVAHATMDAKALDHDGKVLAFVCSRLGEHDLLKVRTDPDKSLLLAVLHLVECIAAVKAKPAAA